MENTYFWIALISLIVSLFVLYYIIKEAVKNGIIEASKELKSQEATNKKNIIPESNWTSEQKDLLTKYESGEISFEEYQKKFNKH